MSRLTNPLEPFELGPVTKAAAKDLDTRECILLAVRHAFPLPTTGAFEDLLAAIDDPHRAAPIRRLDDR